MRNLCLLTVILFCICNNSFAQITGSFRIEEPEVGVFESGYEPYVSISFPESQPMAEIGCPQLPYVNPVVCDSCRCPGDGSAGGASF